MGREVRMVPGWWEHPKNESGHYIPLYEGSYKKDMAEWLEKGEEWGENKPCHLDYMPEFTEEEKTHVMMYEDTSEGTPISPAFETPEELARWLADNGASSFGSDTATYEQWLAMIKAGWAPSMVMSNKGLQSGVEALSE